MKAPKAHIPAFTIEIATSVAKAAFRIAQDEVQKIAERAAKEMQVRLRAQAFDSFEKFPLAQVTLDKKEDLGLSLDTMISTGTYVEKIRAQKKMMNLGRAALFYVGHATEDRAVDERTGRERPDVALNDVAKWNEFGTVTIPARPHWGPARKDLKKQVVADRARIKQLILKEMRRRLGIG